MNFPDYGFTRSFEKVELEQLIERVTEALKTVGFGVLNRIDMHTNLEKSAGTKIPPYVILGACSANFALQAITAEPWIGLLLPCNAVVRQVADGKLVVSLANPANLFTAVNNPSMEPLAKEVGQRLQAVLERI